MVKFHYQKKKKHHARIQKYTEEHSYVIGLFSSFRNTFDKKSPWVISDSTKPGVTIVILISEPNSARSVS
jgi:hypothetical protein